MPNYSHWFHGFCLAVVVLASAGRAQAQITTAQPVDVGVTGQRFTSSSVHNVVAHIPITADADGNTLRSLFVQNELYSPALEGATKDIVENSVRLWYQYPDSGTFSTGTAVALGSMTYYDPGFWEMLFIDRFVQDGGALYVTVDITPFPRENATCAFQFHTGDIEFDGQWFPAGDAPSSPPIIYLTSNKEPTEIQVSHAHLGQPSVSTGQTFSALEFTLDNVDAGQTGAVYLRGVSITVRDAGGAIIAPDTALASLGLRDSVTDAVLSYAPTVPSAAVPVFLPLSTTVTATANRRFTLFGVVTSNTVTAVSSFRLGWDAPADLSNLYLYTMKSIPVTAASGDAFPLQTELYTVQQTATDLWVYHTPVLPADTAILRGQTLVEPLSLTFLNPGNSRTSRVDVTHLTLTVTNGHGDTLTPSAVFSRIALVGATLYGETTSLTGNNGAVTLSLSQSYVPVPAYLPVTATVQVDIAPLATAVDFRVLVAGPPSIIAQDSNLLQIVTVSAANGSDPFPMASNTILLASSLQAEGISVAPATLYAGQEIACLELRLTHPGPSDLQEIALRGVTLSAKDGAGQALDWSRVAESVYLETGAGQRLASVPVPATGSHLFLSVSGFQIDPYTTGVLRAGLRLKSSPDPVVFCLGVEGAADLDVYQPTDPSRPVAVSASWPLCSQPAAVGGGEGSLRLSNYPNPFAAGRETTAIAYYLQQPANVTAVLYTLAGDQVFAFQRGLLQMPGEHVLTWDGRTLAGTVVKNGVYVLRLEALPAGTADPIVQLRKIAVVK